MRYPEKHEHVASVRQYAGAPSARNSIHPAQLYLSETFTDRLESSQLQNGGDDGEYCFCRASKGLKPSIIENPRFGERRGIPLLGSSTSVTGNDLQKPATNDAHHTVSLATSRSRLAIACREGKWQSMPGVRQSAQPRERQSRGPAGCFHRRGDSIAEQDECSMQAPPVQQAILGIKFRSLR